MRFATAASLLLALVGISCIEGRAIARKWFPQQRRQQQQQLQQLSKVRGGAVGPVGSAGAAARGGAGIGPLKRVRGGRTSDAVILVEALAETALESGLIVGFVGAAEYLTSRFLAGKTDVSSDVARLVTWVVAVFGSGAATAGPRKWLDKSQLFKIDVPAGGNNWYANLRKPWFNPPNWLFPIMWIPLKILQVFACYEMWDKLDSRTCLAPPVVVYAVYKSLGDVWNKVFMEKRRLKMGTVVISLYFTTLLAGIKTFFDVSDRAGYLLAPTAAWVAVATCLQWSTWLLNRDEPRA